jgi:hypothetical protein
MQVVIVCVCGFVAKGSSAAQWAGRQTVGGGVGDNAAVEELARAVRAADELAGAKLEAELTASQERGRVLTSADSLRGRCRAAEHAIELERLRARGTRSSRYATAICGPPSRRRPRRCRQLEGGDERQIMTTRRSVHANWHAYQVFTKRADRMRALLAGPMRLQPNTSGGGMRMGNRRYRLPRVQQLRDTPARTPSAQAGTCTASGRSLPLQFRHRPPDQRAGHDIE